MENRPEYFQLRGNDPSQKLPLNASKDKQNFSPRFNQWSDHVGLVAERQAGHSRGITSANSSNTSAKMIDASRISDDLKVASAVDLPRGNSEKSAAIPGRIEIGRLSSQGQAWQAQGLGEEREPSQQSVSDSSAEVPAPSLSNMTSHRNLLGLNAIDSSRHESELMKVIMKAKREFDNLSYENIVAMIDEAKRYSTVQHSIV